MSAILIIVLSLTELILSAWGCFEFFPTSCEQDWIVAMHYVYMLLTLSSEQDLIILIHFVYMVKLKLSFRLDLIAANHCVNMEVLTQICYYSLTLLTFSDLDWLGSAEHLRI